MLDFGEKRWAVEIKLTAAPSRADMDRLNKTARLIGASRRVLVSMTAETAGNRDSVSCNLPSLIEQLRRPA